MGLGKQEATKRLMRHYRAKSAAYEVGELIKDPAFNSDEALLSKAHKAHEALVDLREAMAATHSHTSTTETAK